MKTLSFCLTLLIILSGCKEHELPTVTTGNISSITQTSALCKGYLFSQGSCEVTSKGICWNTTGEPTEYDNTITIDSSTSFTIYLTDLTLNTKYYIRAFAINCVGTAYGETKSFTTEPPYLPEVKTLAVSSITKTSVTVDGEIVSNGGSQIIDCGVCWGTTLKPTLSDNHISNGPETDLYSVSITELIPSTDYFVRAYATNDVGTSYGTSFLVSTSFEPNPNYPIDLNYPTTFYILDPDTLYQRRAAYAEKYKYLITTLNDFGFCSTKRVDALTPPFIGEILQEQALNDVESFILENPFKTGIKNLDDINYYLIEKRTIDDGMEKWVFKISNQKVHGIEVIGTYLSIHTTNREITYAVGNWYPDTYAPDNFVVDQLEAKSLILGKAITLGYEGETGAIDIVSQEDCDLSIINPLILPIKEDDSIELHVTWEMHLTTHSFILYVDVMTGEVIFRRSTIDF